MTSNAPTILITLQAIKHAVQSGHTVYCRSKAYRVIEDSTGQWLIKCDINGHCIGLTWADGQTLNGKDGDFFLDNTK